MPRRRSGRRSRRGSLRRWFHEWRGHKVVLTTERDYEEKDRKFDFYFRRAWRCIPCDRTWYW